MWRLEDGRWIPPAPNFDLHLVSFSFSAHEDENTTTRYDCIVREFADDVTQPLTWPDYMLESAGGPVGSLWAACGQPVGSLWAACGQLVGWRGQRTPPQRERSLVEQLLTGAASGYVGAAARNSAAVWPPNFKLPARVLSVNSEGNL